MLKIATHNSATAEYPKNLLSWLVIPFAKTQSKTIAEQYNVGCRSFDIRVRESNHGNEWFCAHGLFLTKRWAEDIICEINNFPEKCQVCVTYEGKATNNNRFIELVKYWKQTYTNICWGGIAVKYGDGSNLTHVNYDYLIPAEPGYEGGEQGFLALDGRSWHTYLPIPWLWNKLYTTPHKFNEEKYIYVDFL